MRPVIQSRSNFFFFGNDPIEKLQYSTTWNQPVTDSVTHAKDAFHLKSTYIGQISEGEPDFGFDQRMRLIILSCKSNVFCSVPPPPPVDIQGAGPHQCSTISHSHATWHHMMRVKVGQFSQLYPKKDILLVIISFCLRKGFSADQFFICTNPSPNFVSCVSIHRTVLFKDHKIFWRSGTIDRI